MIKVDVSTHIRARVEDVFSHTSNFENDPTWIAEVDRVEKSSDGPPGPGSTFVNYVNFLGKTFQSEHEIVEFRPNERLTIASVAGPVSFQAVYRYEPSAEGTRYSVTIEAEPGGFFKVAAPLVGRTLKTKWEQNLGRLKALFETPAPVPAGQRPTHDTEQD